MTLHGKYEENPKRTCNAALLAVSAHSSLLSPPRLLSLGRIRHHYPRPHLYHHYHHTLNESNAINTQISVQVRTLGLAAIINFERYVW